MLEILKFIKGATTGKSILPVLAHFDIKNNRITGSNGSLTISAPFPLDIECKPIADTFVKAVDKCEDEVDIQLTGAGRLRLFSGDFKAFIPSSPEDYPVMVPEGRETPVDGEILRLALATLEPFIGKDASRPWCTGVLARGSRLYVTNNISVVAYDLKDNLFPTDINIPHYLVKEILRIKDDPVAVRIGDKSLTIMYEGDRWVRGQLLSTEWPDVEGLVNQKLEERYEPDEQFFDDVDKVINFCDKDRRLFISPHFLASHGDHEEGARVLRSRELSPAILNVDLVASMRDMITAIDLSTYPSSPCRFEGDNIKGVIVGMVYNG